MVMNSSRKIRVVIADDTALYRKILSMAVEKIDAVEIVGVASDGHLAVEAVKRNTPDLVLLDVCMPRMDGVEALREIHKLYPDIAVVMFSGVTTADADTTVEALEIGALEFIPKPKTKSLDESMNSLSQELARIIRLLKIRQIRNRVSINTAKSTSRLSAQQAPAETQAPAKRIRNFGKSVNFDFGKSLIVIGVSTGGPNALNQLMSAMPKEVGCPILIVQHMPPFFTASLASFLSKKTGLHIKEAQDGETPKANHVYIAPGGKHMVLKKTGVDEYQLQTNEDPPVNSCRPAVDVMFKSVADEFDGNVLSIILTGMGEDGADGVKYLKDHVKCHSLSQDEASCVVYGMPRAVAERGLADEVLDLDAIAPRVSELMLKRKVC